MIKYTNVEKKAKEYPSVKINASALSFFAKELNEAEGFDELMIKKRALERINGSSFITTHNNIQEYKDKYLTEKYRPLRPYFNTKIPYSFWSQLYVALVERISSKN